MAKSGFYITKEALNKAQSGGDYFWMLQYWKKKGITHTLPTPALRQYAFNNYIRCKRQFDSEIAEGAIQTKKPHWMLPPSVKKVNAPNLEHMKLWHNITVFLHCIITHPLYSPSSIMKLQTGDVVQQLTELN